MRIHFSVIILFVFLSQIIHAQSVSLKISLKASAKDSLANASIQLFGLPDSALLQSQVSNASSNIFSVKPFSKYLIEVSAIGFETKYKTIAVANKALTVILEIKSKSNALDSVIVVAKKPLIKQEDDKTIVDAEVLANSSTNAYEVLEKTPGAMVDQDGNVYLTSSTPATIYINGREMKMSTDDIATLLKSLPAGSVSKIEILRTPSAKYDASNSGGIINIVLKKGIKIGTTGSVNVRYDQGVYGTLSAGFSLNNSIGKLNSYISYQYTHRNYFDDVTSSRLINGDTLLSQKSSTRYSPTTHYIGGGLDYAFNKNFNIAYDLRLTANDNNSHATSTNDFSITDSLNEFYKSQTPISNHGPSWYAGNSLSSKYKIDSAGSEWDNEIDYTYSDNHNSQAYTNTFQLPPLPDVAGNGNTSAYANLFDFKSDLSLRLKHAFILEAGFKISTSSNNNHALYFVQTGSQPQVLDTSKTSTYSYKENINAAYLQLTKTYLGFIFKAGLRYENTNMTGNQFVPVDTSFSIKRNDLFPYFYIKRSLGKIFTYPLTGNIILRRSIIRPGYDALNPTPQFVDPFTYNVGNPRLQPQFTTNYEVNATYNDFPVFAVGTNESKNVWSNVTYQNDTTKIAYRTYDNLGNKREIYWRLFGGLPAGGKYFMYAGVQYNHVQYIGQYQGQPLDYGRGSWTFFTGHELKATPTLRFNVNAWMYVNGFRAFNELKTLGQLNASVTKTVLKKKLSIILSGNDILRTNISRFHLQQGGVLVDGTRVQDSRRVGLTLRHNFGIVHKEEKKELFNQQPVNTEANQ